MSEKKPKPTYSVGYRKPPFATRFKPGQSGNINGRPKGSKNFARALQNELNTRVLITENGKQMKITKLEAIAKQIVIKAANGDPRIIRLLQL